MPVRRFDDVAAHVDRIAGGEERVLTAEPVRLFQPSSGSSGPRKLVPVTATLKAEFQRAVSAWIADLFGHWPAAMDGPAYWSVTPLVSGQERTAAGTPVGFDADSAYLGRLGKRLESHVFAVPNDVKAVTDMQGFRYITLLHMLAASDLRLVSVWSPTFLTLLLDALPEHWDRLLDDLASGRVSPPSEQDDAVMAALTRRIRPDPARAAELAAIGPHDPDCIWPQMALLSCWADGPAAQQAAELGMRWPSATLQPKGLVATEAFVTLPLHLAPGGVLAVRSHFFEFLAEDGGAPLLAHELSRDREYDVLVTTGGGFYRYRLGDRVRVTGFWGEVPCLRFVCRSDHVSDWFGEKLSEPFVDQVLRDLAVAHDLAPHFAVLAPDDASTGFRYTLYIDVTGNRLSRDRLSVLAADLDERLRAGFHYD